MRPYYELFWNSGKNSRIISRIAPTLRKLHFYSGILEILVYESWGWAPHSRSRAQPPRHIHQNFQNSKIKIQFVEGRSYYGKYSGIFSRIPEYDPDFILAHDLLAPSNSFSDLQLASAMNNPMNVVKKEKVTLTPAQREAKNERWRNNKTKALQFSVAKERSTLTGLLAQIGTQQLKVMGMTALDWKLECAQR